MGEIVFNGSYKPLKERDIQDFERWLESRLPPKYRRFLLRVNGGHPHKRQLHECYVQAFYAIAPSNEELSLQVDIEKMAGDLPPQLIPIGFTGIGDRICLSLQDDRIYLWEHERDYEERPANLNELLPLAEDIDELLDSLRGDESPSPDDDISNIGRWGDVGLLDNYLNAGHNINEVSADGNTVMRSAVYAGHLDFLRECVKRGAILANGGLLHAAAFKMDSDIIEYLLGQGLDPNERDERNRTPLDVVLPPGIGPAAQLLQRKGGIRTLK